MTGFTHQEEYLESKNLSSILPSIFYKYLHVVVDKLCMFSHVICFMMIHMNMNKDEKMSLVHRNQELGPNTCYFHANATREE